MSLSSADCRNLAVVGPSLVDSESRSLVLTVRLAVWKLSRDSHARRVRVSEPQSAVSQQTKIK